MKSAHAMLLLGLLISSQSFAASKGFQLLMELQIDEQKPMKVSVITVEGEKATITEEIDGRKNFIEVVASEQQSPTGGTGVLMKFAVGTYSADGSRKVVSKPQILSRYNERAEILVGSDREPHAVKLSVQALAKTL